jgi:hypothetical protein
MIIEIKHPEKKNILFLEVFSSDETFKKVDGTKAIKYLVAVYDPDEEREEYQVNTEEDIKSYLEAVYAPSLDAIIQCFIEFGNLKTDNSEKF